MQGIENQ